MELDRRSVLRAAGVAGAASVLPAGTAAARVDSSFDGGREEALVVFESNEDIEVLEKLGVRYHGFEVLPVAYTRLTADQRERVATLDSVRYVEKNRELEWHNDDARDVTKVAAVQNELGYTGTAAHTVVIDSGIDGGHPDHQANLQHNYRYVDPLSDTEDTTWVEAGNADTDDNGHGTHTSGSVAGDGTASSGQFKGMAPEADLTVYSAGASLLVVKAVAAFDHVLANHGDDVQVVSNSYGISSSHEFNPNGALEVATYEAFASGILPVFSAGNAGPNPDTLNDYAKAPHVLGVAATNDEKEVVDFSSRGREPGHSDGEGANYDRLLALGNLTDYFAAIAAGENYVWDDQPVIQKQSFTGTVGPGVHDPAAGSGVAVEQPAFVEWPAPADAGFVEASLSWTPPGQDIDLLLHEGAKDGPVVASAASLTQPETLSAEIEGGETYYFEVVPYESAGAQFTIDLEARKELDEDFDGTTFGIYRNGVGAPGQAVVSTMNPADPLKPLGPAYGGSGDRVFYGTLSGTSMSCPVTAGIATLVVDAYYQKHGEEPDPLTVLLLIEATAEQAKESYTPANIGKGFVNAKAAVEAVVDGEIASTIAREFEGYSPGSSAGGGGSGQLTLPEGASRLR